MSAASESSLPSPFAARYVRLHLNMTNMTSPGSIVAFVSLIVLAAGVLFQFFVILSGAVNSTPINKTYFLRAATNGLGNAPATSAWTFLALCGYAGSSTQNCRHTVAALPFNPPQNFGTLTNIPAGFLG